MSALLNPLTSEKEGIGQEITIKTTPLSIKGQIVLSAEKREKILSLADSISNGVNAIADLMKSTSTKYFELGTALEDYKRVRPCVNGKVSFKMIADDIGLPVRMVSTSLKIFKDYQNCPERLEDLTLQDAVRIMNPKELPEAEEKQKVEYMMPPQRDWSEEFGFPTLSGIAMNRYRVRIVEGSINILQKGNAAPLTVATCTFEPPKTDRAKASYSDMQKEMQFAIEKY